MSRNKKNIWILGGTGFIGRALVKRISDSGDYKLHLLVHQNIPYRFLEPFAIFTGDLKNFDLSWMEIYPPDIIFHLARLGGSNAFSRSFSSRKGAKANERLILFLSGMEKPPVVVYVSGSLMYGNQQNGAVADENSPLNPVSYARYYSRAEDPWLQAQRSGHLDVRFARPGWIIGPDSWFRIFYRDYFLRSGKVPLYGDGRQLMSLIHLDDCAAQILNLAENGGRGQNLNVFTGQPVTQKDFAECVANYLQAEIEPVSETKLRKLYGKAVAEALTSSIPMTTNYPELCKSDFFQYPDVENMIKSALSFPENKQGVFAKTP
jgi:nucleoside-diphosphate-sugar epimerase